MRWDSIDEKTWRRGLATGELRGEKFVITDFGDDSTWADALADVYQASTQFPRSTVAVALSPAAKNLLRDLRSQGRLSFREHAGLADIENVLDFTDQNLRAHIDEHKPSAIAQRLELGFRHSYLKDFVYGAIDGAVTTFAVVSGVAGAGLSPGIIIILGAANLVGDGFSMAASNFLGTRAEQQLRARARRLEEEHIARYEKGEREEVRQIFAAKGFEGADLENAVRVITSDRDRWVDTMLQEEHGLPLSSPSAWRAAWTTFVAFLLVGLIPLLPFLWEFARGNVSSSPFLASTIMTAVAFVAVGAAKSRFVDHHWTVSGAETLAVGGAAAALAYVAGVLLKGVVG